MVSGGDISLEESIELIKKASRNYAKRQLTWFRRDNRIKWFYVDEYSNMAHLVKHIIDYSEKILRRGLN